MQGIKCPTFSHSPTFPIFDCNYYFLYLSRILADFKVDAILNVFCQSIIFLGWGGGFQVTQWYLSLGQERSPWFLFVWRNLSGIMGVGCGIDILWSPGHCLPGQPQSWDWRMSGYGFPFLLKMLNLNRNLVHFFPGLKNCKVHGWM